jgi:hypothetical protein
MNASIHPQTARTQTVDAAAPAGTALQTSERIHADHVSLKRLGNWTTANRFDVRNRRGAVVVDLRSPAIPAGEIVLDLDIDRGMVKLLVPDDAVIEHWDLEWTGRGKVKDGAADHYAKAVPASDAAEPRRRIVLVGRVRNGEIRVARGGVAVVAAMCSREYVDDLRRAHRTGTEPTVADPAGELAHQWHG